jgi:arylsulfatase A-like enzyme
MEFVMPTRAALTILAVLMMALCAPAAAGGPAPPNIVVIMFDDLSPRIGAFGDPLARTPNLDALAKEAIRFPNTFVTAPVCAPSRAALFSGRHQQTLSAQHMRTRGAAGLPGGGPISYDATPPPEAKWFPELLRRAGYFTVNVGKTDYQVGEPFTVWDASGAVDWRALPKDRPFFAFLNLARTHESYIWPETTDSTDPVARRVAERNRVELAAKPRLTDPAEVRVPAFLPDTPVVRADIARLYDNLAYEERRVGEIMATLRESGELERTVVIVSADHGDGLPRMKRAIHATGLRVPMMVRLPGDLAPTLLALAGEPIPKGMQGRPFLGPGAKANTRVYAGADRFDETQEHQRAVIDGRFQYIRNYRRELPQLQPLAFRDNLPTMQEIWRLKAEGRLTPAVAQWLGPKPAEELYDLAADPDQVRNLAADPAHAGHLARLRRDLDRWIARVGDMSDRPEIEMVEAIWPGRIQPKTAAPVARPARDGVALTSETPGASIGWRPTGETAWRLYVRPIQLAPGAVVEAKAIRYGYAESPVARLSAP